MVVSSPRLIQQNRFLDFGFGFYTTTNKVQAIAFADKFFKRRKEGNLLVYCTEQYKSAKGLTGKQVSELFSKYRVWDYIYSCFEALHTTGENYIVEDIDLYIEARQQAMA